jgi:hypothetical protein
MTTWFNLTPTNKMRNHATYINGLHRRLLISHELRVAQQKDNFECKDMAHILYLE